MLGPFSRRHIGLWNREPKMAMFMYMNELYCKSLQRKQTCKSRGVLVNLYTNMNHIYLLLSRIVAISKSKLWAKHAHHNGKFKLQLNEEPQCIRIETARWCQTDTTLHGRHVLSRRSTTENDRFRSHGQILPTLRQLHAQKSESKIRQSIFLAGEIFPNLTFSTVIPNIIF